MKRRLILCVFCLCCAVLPAAAVLASNSGTVISATVPLVIGSVNVSNITAAGAIVSWQTNGASNSQVEYGIDTGYGLIATQPSDSTASHTVVLNNLAAATNYHFRVRSAVGGLTGFSNDFTFTTLAANGGETTTTTSTQPIITTTTTATTTAATSTTTMATTVKASTTPTTTASTTTTTAAPVTTGTAQTTWTPAADGVTPTTITLSAPGNTGTVTIPGGTKALDKNGNPLQGITRSPPAVIPPAPGSGSVLVSLDLGPSGATFSTPITVEMKFDPAILPAGAGAGDLVIAYYDVAAGAWVPLNNIVIDTVNHTISCTTTHFSQFAVIYAPAGMAAPTTTGMAKVAFTAFSVTPQYNSSTQALTSAAVVYMLTNPGQPLSGVDLILKVSLDNQPLADVSLQSAAQLSFGNTSGSLDYIPAAGWQSGTYTFHIEMDLNGTLYITSTEVNLAGPAVASVRLVLISEIIGAALVVVAGVIGLILIRRHRALKNAGRR